MTEYLDRQLRDRRPCEIVIATLPSDALRQVARRPVPLVICDDTSPSMRSFQLMGEIKALSPETHVVLIVPSGSLEQERRAKRAGADTYIPSTFAFKRLLPILDDVLP
jgi:DNA-binding NarL/FixJ family response regulator